jgi:hypothetical protein
MEIQQRQTAIGKRISDFLKHLNARAATLIAVNKWIRRENWGVGTAAKDLWETDDTGSKMTPAGESIPSLPYPAHVDSEFSDEISRGPNNSFDENLVILGAALQAYSADDPILPCPWDTYQAKPFPWGLLIQRVSQFGKRELQYLDQYLDEAQMKLLPPSNSAKKKQPRARKRSGIRNMDNIRLIGEIGVLRSQNPGINMSQIARRLDCDRSALTRRAQKNPAISDALRIDVGNPESASIDHRTEPRSKGGRVRKQHYIEEQRGTRDRGA